MHTTAELLDRVWNSTLAMAPDNDPPDFSGGKTIHTVPTLDPTVSRPVTPMLHDRFRYCGGWRHATHGDWLSIEEMQTVALGSSTDQRMKEIVEQQRGCAVDWMNDAGGLFLPSRLSYFAGQDYSYERVYLLWPDDIVEPEVWAYDANGLARFRDLNAYLWGYLQDDLAVYEQRWLLAERDLP